MVERYAREKMKKLWDMNAKYSAWLEVEKALVRGWNKLGLIPDSDCEKICKNAKFDIKRIDEIEAVYTRYKEQTEKINKNGDEFFSRVAGFGTLAEDDQFNMIKEPTKGTSVADFLSNN